MVVIQNKKRVLRFSLILLLLFVFSFVTLYELIQSPRFLQFVVNRLNQSIRGSIHYDSLNLNLKNRNLNLKGFVFKNKAGETVVSLNLLDLDFSPINALRARLDVTRLRVEGLIIDQRKIAKRLTPSAWKTTLRLILKRISVTDSLIDHIDIYLNNGDEFYFDQATVLLTPQFLGKQKIAFWVNRSVLKPADLEIKSSTLSFEGEIKIPVLQDFTFLVSEAKGKLKLQEVQVENLPTTSFESDFRIGGNTLYLGNGLWHLPDGTVTVDIDYIPKDSTYKVDLKTSSPLPFKEIPKISEHLLKTFDKFEISLRAELQGFSLSKMTGKVELHAKTLGNKANPKTPEHDLDLKGKMKNGSLQLDDVKIHSAKTDLTATGQIDFAKQKLDVSVNTKGFDLATLLSCFSDLELSGYVNAQGTIKGDFKSPEFTFNGQGDQAGYSFLHFGKNEGLFKISQGTLTYDGKAPPDAGYTGSVSVRAENIYKKERHTVLKTQFNNVDVTQLTDNAELKGKVTGTFDMEDYYNTTPTATMKADVHDFWVQRFHLGEIHAEGKMSDQKFVLNPVTFQMPNYEKITVPKEAVFEFNDKGVTLKAEVLPGANITGSYLKNVPTKFNIDTDLNHVDIRPLMQALEMHPVEGYGDGKVKMVLGLNKAPTTIDINLSRFTMPLEEGDIQNAEPIDIAIRPPNVIFNKVRFKAGQESFGISGNWNLDGAFTLRLTGKLDLQLLKLFPKYFREGSGFADLDLKLGGTQANPQASGDITFKGSALTLRALRGDIEDLNGKLSFSGNKVNFDNLRGTLSEGDIIVNGSVDLKDFTPSYFDLKIETREAAIAEPNVYKVVFSGDFSLKGPVDNSTLSGKMFITDGRYSRNFDITQFILRPQAKNLPEEPNSFLEHLNLDLDIKSSGELAIKNNVAKMYLQADVQVKGTPKKPDVSGALEILDGEFKYFKVSFENAKGIIDFRDMAHGPYVDVTASKEITSRFSSVTVGVHIEGYTDNLQLNFTSDAGLEKRDILALVFTGALPGEGGGFTSTQLASTVVASQLSTILQGTVAEKAQLDIFRLEASDPEKKNLSTLVVGKKLTERLSLEFKTDLGVDEPLQGIQMEYILIDKALLKASQLTDGSFNFDFTLRWRSY